MSANSLDTPVVTVDLDTVERNIARLQQLADRHGVKVRPHTKTHKSVAFTNAQLQAGAHGITVAKLGEAEVMANAGVKDILIAYPIIGTEKLERLQRLMQQAKITVALDSLIAAQGLSDLGVAVGRTIPIYIELDTGLKRIGLQPGEAVIAFARSLQSMPGIKLTGLMSHGGHCYGAKTMEELQSIAANETEIMLATKRQLESLGMELEHISVGASPTTRMLEFMDGVTEIRPGTYIFNDYNQMLLGSAQEEDCAVRIYATVISRPAKDRIAIDAGSKTFTSDLNVSGKSFGYVLGHPDFDIERLSEEHGVISIPSQSDIKVGDILCIIPNHVCPVINLADEIAGLRNGQWSETVTIEARGKNR